MRSYLAVALLGLGSTTYAAIQKACPSSNVCFSLNIPDNTASSGNGDIYFQLSAPTSMSWVALGQGSSMSGSNIFVMYTSSSGNNVTISPRVGKGRSEPKFNSAAQVTLLDGSGVSNGVMTANVKCSNCQSWSGGSMDFTSSSGTWIWAAKSGSPLNSDDQSVSINQHGNQGSFRFDFKQAAGGSSVNPFVSANVAASSGGAASSSGGAAASRSGAAATTRKSCTPKSKSKSGSSVGAAVATATAASATGSAASAVSGASGPSDSKSSTGQTNAATAVPSQYASYASYYASVYGTYASNYPTSWQTAAPFTNNAVVERDTDDTCDDGSGSVSSSSNLNAVNGNSGNGNFAGGFSQSGSYAGYERYQRMLIAHAVLACLAFAVFFPFGAISIRILSFPGLIWFHAAIQILAYVMFVVAFGLGLYIATYRGLVDSYHPIIGIVLFVLLAFQPILGVLHHKLFKKYKRRTVWSYGHLWLGRIIITLGIINGGLGFLLANNTRTGPIIYGIVAGIIWIVYVAAAVYGEIKRARAAPPPYSERMQSNEGSPISSTREFYGKRSGA